MKKVLIAFTIFALSIVGLSSQVFATNEITQFGAALGKENANVLTGCAERTDGIMCLIETAIDILSIGVGILGVIGISITGIQYLTAGGSEEKTRKAKRRMLEIVIGIVVYAVLYALVQFILPPASNSGGGSSGSGTTTQDDPSDGSGSTLHTGPSGEDHGGRSHRI